MIFIGAIYLLRNILSTIPDIGYNLELLLFGISL
jgi:hypothetical protein